MVERQEDWGGMIGGLLFLLSLEDCIFVSLRVLILFDILNYLHVYIHLA
jgi:hypothetical protein